MKRFRVSIIRDDQVIASKVLDLDMQRYAARMTTLAKWYHSLVDVTPREGDDVRTEFVK